MDSPVTSGTAHIICDILDLLNFVADGLNKKFLSYWCILNYPRPTQRTLKPHNKNCTVNKISLSVHCENCTCITWNG